MGSSAAAIAIAAILPATPAAITAATCIPEIYIFFKGASLRDEDSESGNSDDIGEDHSNSDCNSTDRKNSDDSDDVMSVLTNSQCFTKQGKFDFRII